MMQLVALVFIIPWEALYVFRVLFAPIIRSVLKLKGIIKTRATSCNTLVVLLIDWFL
jgi:hypothetical protein